MGWIGPLIMAGGQALGSSMSANASNNAATDISNASALSSATQLGMYNQTRTDLLPYMTSGNAALSQLDRLMGITPQASDVPQNTLGPITDAINNRAFNPSGPAVPANRANFERFVDDPLNVFQGKEPNLLNPFAKNGLLGKIGLAHGGAARGGQTYVVGEKGPEILHMSPGSKGFVEPNSPKANYMAYGHRAYGGPVGAFTGDPILGGRIGGYRPGTPLPMPTIPYSPVLGQGRGPIPTGYSGPIHRPGMPMAYARAGGGPVEGFNPLNDNSTPLSTGGQTPNAIMAQAPQYQFTEQQGIQGLDQSAAASGELLSGGHLKDILNYSQGLASEQYQNIYNNLMGLTSLGESAGAMVGNAGTYAGMGIGNSQMAGGQALASGAIGSSNAINSGFGNLGFMYAMNPGIFSGGSGGGTGKSTANGGG